MKPFFLCARLTLISIALMLGGCALIPRADTSNDMPPPTRYESGYSIPEANGAIYQASTSLALFEDQKARRVGDILTITLTEATNATKSSTTSTSKSTAATINNPTVMGYNVTRDGVPILSGNLGGDQEFSGEGGATQSNRLDGSVTVTVVKRLPNGNLHVQGEKWLTLNQGKEYVRVSGIVRPVDILANNSVSSEKVANARIEYAGKGALADANRMSWLARFFNSPWVPF
ncbi:MAG: flagellar basal body L-ring protein FlgH [Pseudomonadota bacterium]